MGDELNRNFAVDAVAWVWSRAACCGGAGEAGRAHV